MGWESIRENLWHDVRFSARLLLKSPGFSAVAVLSLALGIGANTAIFTLINGLMLTSLPVRNPQNLVAFGTEVGGGAIDDPDPGALDIFPYEFYERLQSHHPPLEGITAYASFNTQVSFRLSGHQDLAASLAISHLVSGNFFQVLEAAPLLGRTLLPSDSQIPGREPVAVVSYAFWQNKLLGDPNAVGNALSLNGISFTVVGVMPANFSGVSMSDETPDLWVPLTMQAEITMQPSLLQPRGLYFLHLMARRASNVPLGRIQAWITSQLLPYITGREGPALSPQRRNAIAHIYVPALPGDGGISNLRDQYGEPLKVLMALVALVLLIACANLANFLLARAAAREREISTRLALGSGRVRIVSQFLIEAILIAVLGGALGLALSYAGTQTLLNFIVGAAHSIALSPAPDVPVLLFTLAVSLLTGVLVGLAPISRVSRLSVSPVSQVNVRTSAGGGGRSGRRIPQLLIASQIVLSVLLVSSAGLFARTLYNLQNRDFGFNRKNVLLVHVNPKFAGYTPDKLNALYEQILDHLRAIPGVLSGSLSGSPPIRHGSWNSPIVFKGSVAPKDNTDTLLDRVGSHYFETLNIPLLRGRVIGEEDTPNSLKVAVVNKAFADYFFPQGDAIGHTFTIGDPEAGGEFQIVGIVANSKYVSPREDPQRMTYLPVAQLTGNSAYAYNLELRTGGEPLSVLPDVRRALASINPNLAVLDYRTMAQQTNLQMANEILIARLSVFFALLAVVLASIGLYGVMSYNVLRRSGEIGIRLALGAQPTRVLWMILGESFALLAIGIAIGLPVTLAAARLFQTMLFGLTPSDPYTLAAAVSFIGIVVLLAAFFPARKATRLDPASTLRTQ